MVHLMQDQAYFVFVSDLKSCFCAYHISKAKFILQPHDQKSCRRQTQYSSTLCDCLCTWPIWCCPLQPLQMRYLVVNLDQKSCYLCAYHISKANFILQPHDQKSCRRQTQCSSTLCICLCTWPIWCCPMEPLQMRYLVVHFDQKSCYYFCVCNIRKMNLILQTQQ